MYIRIKSSANTESASSSIKSWLLQYRFAATIEVTNGMIDLYEEKANQALLAKHYLEGLASAATADGDRVTVATGLAYVVSNTRPEEFHGINVQLQVSEYNPLKLLELFERTCTCGLIREKGKPLMDCIRSKNDKGAFLSCMLFGNQELVDQQVTALSAEPNDNTDHIRHIKGILMEYLVGSLFEDRLDCSWVQYRHGFLNGGVPRDADVVVFCPEDRFYGAIDAIGKVQGISARVLTMDYRIPQNEP